MRKGLVLAVLLGIVMLFATVASAASTTSVQLYSVQQGGKFGFIDNRGKLVIKPQFDAVEEFSEGRAKFRTGTNPATKYGYIDTSGKVVVQPIYDSAMDYHEGVATVMIFEDSRLVTRLIDSNGKTVLELQESFAFVFNEGLAAYFERNPFTSYDGEARLYGFMNKKGKVVIEPTYVYKPMWGIPVFSEGLAAVRVDDRWGYINTKGEAVIPTQYEQAGAFNGGLAAIQNDQGLWGFIDKKGKVVIKPQFEDAMAFNEGLAPVMVTRKGKERWGFIDKKGKFVIQPQYQSVDNFSEGLAPVNFGDSAKESWGYINTKGKTAIKAQFTYAEPFRGGVARVTTEAKANDELDGQPVGYINKQGKYIWKPSK